MTAKKFLSEAYQIDQRINSKLEQVQSLRSLATKATSTLSGNSEKSSNRNIHRMEDIIIKITELEDEINVEIDRLVDVKRDVMKAIERVPTFSYRTLLELRYVCCKTWEEIAVEMSYTMRWVYIIHERALKEVKI